MVTPRRCGWCGGEIILGVHPRFDWRHRDANRDRLCDLAYPAGDGDPYDEDGRLKLAPSSGHDA